MAKARKLPSGNWNIRVGDGKGGKAQSFTAPTKKEVELMAAEYVNGKLYDKQHKTVGACIDEYIAMKENVLSPTTISGYKKMRKNSLDGLCLYEIDALTQEDLQRYFNKISERLSPKYVKNTCGLLSAVFRMFRPNFRMNVTLPKKQKVYKEFPTVEQVYDAVKGTSIELPCLLAMWEGMRMSEIRGAKKSSIKNGVLTINNVVVTVDGKRVEKKQTKTYGSTRKLRLPPYILNLIEALPADQDYLVTRTGQSIYMSLQYYLRKNDLPLISFHDLRHMNASAMLALGVPDKYAMERGGWSSPEIMRNTYQHTFSEERKKVDDTVDNYFSSIIK